MMWSASSETPERTQARVARKEKQATSIIAEPVWPIKTRHGSMALARITLIWSLNVVSFFG